MPFPPAEAKGESLSSASSRPKPPLLQKKTIESPAVVSANGDLVLHLQEIRLGLDTFYRVEMDILRRKSAYFEALLDPYKFSEGASIHAQLAILRERHGSKIVYSSILFSDLPLVKITDLGPIPREGASEAFQEFLCILHGCNSVRHDFKSRSTALLAILADRFAAIKPIKAYLFCNELKGLKRVPQDKYHATQAQLSLAASSSDETRRQWALTGLIFGFSGWVAAYTSSIIFAGSPRWETPGQEASPVDELGITSWSLPRGIEEELVFRRDCILSTLSSLQHYFLQLYTSRERQCKLGYDSSAQCDSFQLGEMVRFFSRKGTLNLQSAMSEHAGHDPYSGNIQILIGKFQQAPEYQLDQNHTHCGLRSRLLPILRHIEALGQVGVCLRCWTINARSESWLKNPGGRIWTLLGSQRGFMDVRKSGGITNCADHRFAKALYTAEVRDWRDRP